MPQTDIVAIGGRAGGGVMRSVLHKLAVATVFVIASPGHRACGQEPKQPSARERSAATVLTSKVPFSSSVAIYVASPLDDGSADMLLTARQQGRLGHEVEGLYRQTQHIRISSCDVGTRVSISGIIQKREVDPRNQTVSFEIREIMPCHLSVVEIPASRIPADCLVGRRLQATGMVEEDAMFFLVLEADVVRCGT